MLKKKETKRMKINVHGGHNRHVPGIISYLDEVTEDRRIKNAVIAYMRKEGHTVYDCTESDARTQRGNLSGIVKKCNAHAVDLDVSIHINGCKKSKKDRKTKGVEVLIQNSNSKAKAAAERICKKVAALGFTNRGVKVRKDLYVLNRTKAPALLAECCFADDEDDAIKYKKVGASAIGKAIAEGILNKEIKEDRENIGSVEKAEATKAFRIRTNRTLVIYSRPGGSRVGKAEANAYTIIATKYKRKMPYGKLKSGAGWIKIHSKYCIRL